LIDHLLYSHTTLQLCALLEPLTAEELATSIGADRERGLPDRLVPSDHLPIGAVFNIDCGAVRASVAAAASASDKAGSVDAAANSTLSEETREVLTAAHSTLMAELQHEGKTRGKPTEGEIARRRAHASKVKEWIATLSECERAFVKGLSKHGKKVGRR
jgi:hypothetical protein